MTRLLVLAVLLALGLTALRWSIRMMHRAAVLLIIRKHGPINIDRLVAKSGYKISRRTIERSIRWLSKKYLITQDNAGLWRGATREL